MTGRAERAIFGAASWRMVRPTPQHHPINLQFKAHEASASMTLLTPHQNPAGQGSPEASVQATRLTSENLAWVDEKMKETGWAKRFLISAGLLDSKGHWNPSYWPEDGEAG